MRTRGRTAKYDRYISSLDWQIKRMEALAAAGHECQRCTETSGLEVHHRTYRRLGAELPQDLEVLCGLCHRVADEQRRETVRQDNADRLWEAQLAGWSKKRWGEDWEYHPGYEIAEERFEAWLADRDD